MTERPLERISHIRLSRAHIALLSAAPLGALIATVVLAVMPDPPLRTPRPLSRPAPNAERVVQPKPGPPAPAPRQTAPKPRPCYVAPWRCSTQSRRCLASIERCFQRSCRISISGWNTPRGAQAAPGWSRRNCN